MLAAKTPAHAKAREAYIQRQIAKDAKREDNQAMRANRSPQQQLARLDKLLGKDQGAKKERARLNKQILGQSEEYTLPKRNRKKGKK